MYKIEILYDKKWGALYFMYTSLLFFIGLVLDDTGSNFTNFLKLPLFNLAIFYFFVSIFYLFYKRVPINTAWSYGKTNIKDVVFNILYWVLGFLIPMFTLFG